MPRPPGQEPGHAASGTTRDPHALSWADYIDELIARRGTLAAVALHMAERRGFSEDVESVERGLRRLRGRGSRGGGVWGQRALACFGLPSEVDARIRWMGQYHSRFTDLPASIAEELLRPWDRPPVSDSPARIWVLLGWVGLGLRQREDVSALLQQAALLAARAEPAAQVELLLVQSFAWGRVDPSASAEALARAGALLESPSAQSMPAEDRACLFARWIDQRAYPLNKPTRGPPDHAAAARLYERIDPEGPLFARCRRENGLGWSRLKLGDRAAAEAHARASVEAAGDRGSLRLRAMALKLLSAATEGETSRRALSRARAIAKDLEDLALAMRLRPRTG